MTTKGYRIRQVRELRGWTQADLADRIGVRQPAIAQIEGGRCEPSDDTLRGVARVSGFPISFLNLPTRATLPLGSLLYRGRAALSAREQAQAHRLAEVSFEMAERLGEHVRQYPVRVPRLTEPPIAAARVTRAVLGLSPDTPIPNLLNVLERAGVLVLALPEGTKWDAFSAWAGDAARPVLVLAANRPGDRTNWNLAHELAHLVLHQAPTGQVSDLEKQADAFAAEFLLPEAAMRHELLRPLTIRSVARLKPRWRVSIQALVRRAHELGVISVRQYRYMFQQIARFGWRTREPAELDVPVARPRALKKMTEVLYGRPIDARRLAADLNLLPGFVTTVLASYAEGPVAPPPKRGRILSLAARRGEHGAS